MELAFGPYVDEGELARAPVHESLAMNLDSVQAARAAR